MVSVEIDESSETKSHFVVVVFEFQFEVEFQFQFEVEFLSFFVVDSFAFGSVRCCFFLTGFLFFL